MVNFVCGFIYFAYLDINYAFSLERAWFILYADSVNLFLGTERFSKNKDACFNLFLYKNKENRLRFVSLPKSQFGLAQRT